MSGLVSRSARLEAPLSLRTRSRDRKHWWIPHQQVDMVSFSVHLDKLGIDVIAGHGEDCPQCADCPFIEHRSAALHDKDEMGVNREDGVPCAT
jgi:hypothetical protein